VEKKIKEKLSIQKVYKGRKCRRCIGTFHKYSKKEEERIGLHGKKLLKLLEEVA
jgi:hypothetical protein